MIANKTTLLIGREDKLPIENVFDAVDPRIVYPSYKSFDDFIDLKRLKSLDGYLTQRIRRRLAADKDNKFYTGPYTLDTNKSGLPGSRMICLSDSARPDNYFDLDRTDLWAPSTDATEFSLLMDFIRTLPFAATGRMLIMYDDVARDVPPHRDHIETDICHEFLWFRSNLRKPFYMYSPQSDEKTYVESHSAWFDSVNQYHGSDAFDGLSFSVRVDGRFTDEFRASIPKPEINPSSTPSFWATKPNSTNKI